MRSILAEKRRCEASWSPLSSAADRRDARKVHPKELRPLHASYRQSLGLTIG
jgi:hypothetical protein